MTNGEVLVENMMDGKILKNHRSNHGMEFTGGREELRSYQFNKYISSCTCFLMDKRLAEKRRRYNGMC